MNFQPRIRRKSVPAEEYLPGNGIRETEGRRDREDIKIAGWVSETHINIDLRENGGLIVANFRSYASNSSSSDPLCCDAHVRNCPLELIGVDGFMEQ